VTCSPVTRRPVKTTTKWRFEGKITPLTENFQNSSVKIQQSTAIDVFAGISCRSVSLQRKASSYCTRYKNIHIFTAILRPFGPGRQTVNIWDSSSAYMCL